MITKGIKFRIYPNKEQEELLAKSFGCTRYVYNWALDLKTKTYQTEKKSISRFDLDKQLTQLKKEKEWLKEVPSQTLQQSLSDLDKAFTKFFKEKKRYPKFKSKYDKQSVRFPQGFELLERHIAFPKLGKISTKISKDLSLFKINNITVSKTKTGKYFASVCYTEPFELPAKPEPKLENAVGVDLGVKIFATISNGEEVENPKHFHQRFSKVRYLNRQLSKKKSGGKNREKARLKLARQYEKVSDLRQDFQHKLSTRLIRENQTICLEDLNVEGMIKNRKLSRQIQDAAWGYFNIKLDYKSDWYGANILRIGRFEPSSKLCICGYLNKDLKLSDREWLCPKCKARHKRDILASSNIKSFAFLENPTKFFTEVYELNKTPWGTGEASVEAVSLETPAKQKPAKSARTKLRKESNAL